MSFWDRMFGSGAKAILARRAEARGELAQAAALWVEAGRADEAGRVMIMCGEAESDQNAKRPEKEGPASGQVCGEDADSSAASAHGARWGELYWPLMYRPRMTNRSPSMRAESVTRLTLEPGWCVQFTGTSAMR